jgi:hypothetical protein
MNAKAAAAVAQYDEIAAGRFDHDAVAGEHPGGGQKPGFFNAAARAQPNRRPASRLGFGDDGERDAADIQEIALQLTRRIISRRVGPVGDDDAIGGRSVPGDHEPFPGAGG